MVSKYKWLLLIFCLINFTIFIYYLSLSDINPTNDSFYYMSVADSFYNGTGFYDITEVKPQAILTTQNGIVFMQVFLLWAGLHDPGSRLLAIKLINYLGFICLILIFYKMFRKFKVSREIILLCMGILLLSAHFLKTILAPINDGFYCFLTSWIFYEILSNDNESSFIKFIVIGALSILVANFRLNGPLIVLGASLTYGYLREIRKSLIYLIIFCISYASVFALLELLHIDLSGIKSISAIFLYKDFIIKQILLTFIYTIPGAFWGISGRQWIITLPFSILCLVFYIRFCWSSLKENSFPNIFIIVNILLLLLFILITPIGNTSRYIIMIIPFSLLAIAIYFKDSVKLRNSLSAALLLTFFISAFRLVVWDSVFFVNNTSHEYVKEKLTKYCAVISQSPRVSYYIFNKGANDEYNIDKDCKVIVIFGNKEYIESKSHNLKGKYDIKHIENTRKEFILGHSTYEQYQLIKVFVN